jgi:uncharacterized protein YecE (DUF72 family)
MSGAPLRVGVAGWSYADWKGVVYPRGCKDTLRHVAALVDLIEINSTFYRVPPRAMVEGWVERTADLDTFFTAKIPQDVTHGGRLDAELARAFADGMAPLCEAGRLRALLAQFSFRFEWRPQSLAHLRSIADAFGPLAPMVVEVRHRSWRAEPAQQAVLELGMALAHLDYPGAASGFAGPERSVFDRRRLAYLRLHGRNREAWFRKDAGRDQVYDWDYSPGEVRAIEQRLVAIAESSPTGILVVANNHFRGQAVKVALELIAWYRKARIPVPTEMRAAYPELDAIASK